MTDYDKEWKDLFGDIVITEDGKVDENDIPSYTMPDTITLNDVTFTSDTIVLGDGTNDIYTKGTDWLTINDSITTGGTVSVDSWGGYELWKDCMPSLYEVEAMCKEYPALQKAYENFKTIYKMVEQDYKGKQNDS